MKRLGALLAGGLVALSCGASPSSPSSATTIVIGSAGLSASEVRIKAWSQVRFTNNDTRPHSIVSDPIDLHSDCPPVNQVGLLNPGESRNTGTLNLTKVCRFHDHPNHSDQALRGRIVVQ
jgi:hypothetical protein